MSNSREFARGETLRAFETDHGRAGMLVCEDLWHQTCAWLLAQDGAQLIYALSNGPTRGARPGREITSVEVWRQLLQVTAHFLTSYAVFVNRVGCEDGLTFGGGSMVVDPFGRVVSVAHMALVPSTDVKLKTTEKYSDVRWWPISRLPKLAYDHKWMAEAALQRLSGKLSYTNIAWSVLPGEFTLGELQSVYEAVLGKGLDKRNFRKKFLSLTLLKRAGKLLGRANRPAQLYSFRTTEPMQIEIV